MKSASTTHQAVVVVPCARALHRRPEPLPQGFLARGTRIISKAGEINELDRGEVHTGPMAEGFIHDVWPDQETCYGVTFQKTGVTICLTREEVASGDYEVKEPFRDNEVIGFDSEFDGNFDLVLWNAEYGVAENIGQTLEDFGIANLHQRELARLGVDEAVWKQAVDTTVEAIRRHLASPSSPQVTFDRADRATMLAALQFYLDNGQGDPENRSSHIHELATDQQLQISLDAVGVTDLMQRVNVASMFDASSKGASA